MKRLLISASICLLAMATFSVAAEDKKEGPVCPVSGKKCVKEHNVAYKGAEVYFCCPNCPKAFEANTEKYAAKANLQLAQTDQAKQVKCPFTGKDVNKTKTVKVNGEVVAFCCGNCQGKAKKADDQVALIFSDKSFDKGYEVKKKDE